MDFKIWLIIRIICSRSSERQMINMLNNKLKIDALRIKSNYCLYKSKISDFKIKECSHNRPHRIQVEFLKLIKRRGRRDHLELRLKIW